MVNGASMGVTVGVGTQGRKYGTRADLVCLLEAFRMGLSQSRCGGSETRANRGEVVPINLVVGHRERLMRRVERL